MDFFEYPSVCPRVCDVDRHPHQEGYSRYTAVLSHSEKEKFIPQTSRVCAPFCCDTLSASHSSRCACVSFSIFFIHFCFLIVSLSTTCLAACINLMVNISSIPPVVGKLGPPTAHKLSKTQSLKTEPVLKSTAEIRSTWGSHNTWTINGIIRRYL